MFIREEKDGVVFFRSDKIKEKHGFSTRIGGISTLPHLKSLNLGFYRGDTKETVLENLDRFSRVVGFSRDDLVAVTQIHSNIVKEISYADRGAGIYRVGDFECDGYVTTVPGVALCVRIADCTPILLSDSEAGVVGAVHAGWRGTAASIASVCVEKMVSLGADRKRIVAAIGPSIGSCCYEVKEDFVEAFRSAAGIELADRYISEDGAGGYRADLKGANREILLRSGLSESNIDVTDMCTSCRDDLFYSHRKSHGERGSMCAVIGL